MGEEIKEWAYLWGAKVKLRNDMPDDMLKDAIDTARKAIDKYLDFDSNRELCAEEIKLEFDKRWNPHWHVIVGKNFGSYVTYETRKFAFFYIGDKDTN